MRLLYCGDRGRWTSALPVVCTVVIAGGVAGHSMAVCDEKIVRILYYVFLRDSLQILK